MDLTEEFARLPDLLAAHVVLSLSALAIGALISLPLGVLSARSRALSGPALAFASVVQTIPALALLALMVPLFGRIGFVPAFVALTLYSMLPMLRNVVVGLQGVDPAVRDAAVAVGMTPAQALMRVELPLALPTIIAGVRTATVWVVGAATLSTPVGAPSLGDFIFSGLQTRNWEAVLFGCVFSAGLAITLDQCLRIVETGVAKGESQRIIGAVSALGLIILAAIAPNIVPRPGGPDLARDRDFAASASGPASLDGQTVTIGAKAFTEQYILAELIALRLQEAGAVPEIRTNLGSTVAFDALVQNEIDLYVDYTGTLWANVLNHAEPIARERMAVRTAAELLDRHGVLMLGRLGFENAYGFAVTQDTADIVGASIDGLNRLDGFQIGADPEFFARTEWTRVKQAYGLTAARERSMDSTFMYDAVRRGDVDVVTAYTTDGRISAFDLVVLDDPAQALPPYDAVVLLSGQASADRALIDALTPLMNAISPEAMRSANQRVDLDGASPQDAANWLDQAIQ